jgi:transcriptional regulator with XRE-family HTH domain
MNSILVSFREYRNLTEEDLANELSISLQEYKYLECGIELVNAEMATALSIFYNAPPQVFLIGNTSCQFSFIYSHCYFHGGNGYVNNMNNELDNKELILLLEKELKALHELNQILSKKLTNLR